jgi:hypothetical protein
MGVAVGLEAGAAVGEFPAAADDDEPDEVEGGDNPGSGEDGDEVGTLLIQVEDGRKDNGDFEGGEADGEDQFGPAPLAGALLLTDTGDDDGCLEEDEEDPEHAEYLGDLGWIGSDWSGFEVSHPIDKTRA